MLRYAMANILPRFIRGGSTSLFRRKRPEKSLSPMAHVLARKPIVASPDAIIAVFRERFEDVPIRLALSSIEGQRGFILEIDDLWIGLMFQDVGLDLGELQPLHGALRDADGPLLDNAALVTVTALGDREGHAAIMQASMAALRVASVVSELPGAHAVIWSYAGSLTPVESFQEQVAASSEHDAPVGVLTRMALFQTGEQDGQPLLGIWAVGLAPLVGRDIEFVPKPLAAHQLFDVCISTANWLSLKGPVFKDRDTIGVTETECIRVHHRDRGSVLQGPVYLMDIESLDPSVVRSDD